jgi:hypothetical protein
MRDSNQDHSTSFLLHHRYVTHNLPEDAGWAPRRLEPLKSPKALLSPEP